MLGERRQKDAADPLRALALESPHPLLAAQALRSLVAIEGSDPRPDTLERLAQDGPMPVRHVAHPALGTRGHGQA